MSRDFNIEKQIHNDTFYAKMIERLEEIWPNHSWVYSDKNGKYYCGVDLTIGWYQAMRGTCFELNYNSFIEYWNKLPWYESDLCDANLSDKLVEYFIKNIKE